MHMADALLAPTVAATMYVTSGLTAGISVRSLRKLDTSDKLPVMAVSAALVFAGQMINYTIPGTGSSGHLCGGMMLSALLGPQAGFLSMIVILAIQCLFFADGGLMALGANCWNMAFYGCFVGYYLIWKPIMKTNWFSNKGQYGAGRIKIIIASLLGCIITLQLGAFSVVLETSISGITDLPFVPFMMLMQPIHLAIGLVEGAITAAVLVFIYESRPELLLDVNAKENDVKSRLSLKSTLVIVAVVTLLVGGVFSLFASSNPDGLEWSLFGNAESGYSANMSLDEEDYGLTSTLSDAAASIQEKTAVLPDYAFSNSDSEIGTSVSGIIGSLFVALAAAGVYFIGAIFKKGKQS